MDLIPMEKLNINWYPGHMAKTRREMAERLSAVDLVAEIQIGRAYV